MQVRSPAAIPIPCLRIAGLPAAGIILQSLLEKLDIKSSLKRRNKINNRYRIRISKTSMDRVISLVKPHMHNDFLYKLGI